MAKSNGKTDTHYEQIPLETVERIAITDVHDAPEGERRAVDRAQEPARPFQIRRATDRRRSDNVAPSTPIRES